MALERKIYSSWAFTDEEHEKASINRETYKELEEKAQVVYQHSVDKMAPEKFEKEKAEKSLLLDFKHGYGHTCYKILSNPHNLSNLELALVADGGNLCFGFTMDSPNIIHIFTD